MMPALFNKTSMVLTNSKGKSRMNAMISKLQYRINAQCPDPASFVDYLPDFLSEKDDDVLTASLEAELKDHMLNKRFLNPCDIPMNFFMTNRPARLAIKDIMM